MYEFKRNKILFIKGVFLKNCTRIDEIFEEQITEHLNYQEEIVYQSVPTSFNGLDSWVQKTNVRCWYCDLNFQNTLEMYRFFNKSSYLCV